MKVIALMPVKNEAWIIEKTLEPLSKFCDHIIVADQNSTDETREIAKKFPQVQLIHNTSVGHSNAVRWMLLDEARKIPGNNLIINIDADEILPPHLFLNFLSEHKDELKPGVSIEVPWIQLWKSIHLYRDDGVWSNNWKSIAFVDDRKCDYIRDIVINDHTSRIPDLHKDMRIKAANLPLLHYQWVSWNRVQMKQAWYRCSELLSEVLSAKAINAKYADSLEDPRIVLKDVPLEWQLGINIQEDIASSLPDWHFSEILSWFDCYGPNFFRELDIWHIQELATEYRQRVGSKPPSSGSKHFLKFSNKLRQLARKLIS